LVVLGGSARTGKQASHQFLDLGPEPLIAGDDRGHVCLFNRISGGVYCRIFLRFPPTHLISFSVIDVRG